MTVRGTAREKFIELDDALPFPPGQLVSVEVQPVESGPAMGSPARLLAIVRQPPHVSESDLAEWESAIESG